MTSRPSTAAPILAVLAIVLVTLTIAYIGAYRWMAIPSGGRTCVYRKFRHKWQAKLLQPAGWAESKLIGTECRVLSIDDYIEIQNY
jgi:hypothetical protein